MSYEHVLLDVDADGVATLTLNRPQKRNAWNRQATAAELDINRTTLYKKMRKYRLDVGETNYTPTPVLPLPGRERAG